MRLTLRTLLAYLDDILDPADKEELSQKIESSEFAEDLVHRTRDTMRRLRLSAPQVVGTGMGLDPNTVAEYLDNVLPPDQVGDFERICLESDVHLAEVAACHHVLTMVLGEPADVDPRARQRMYGIPAEARERKRMRAEPAHVPGTSTTVVPAAVPVAPIAAPAVPAPVAARPVAPFEIPEYLRTRTWWRSRGALAGLAIVMLAGITIYLASGLKGWFGGEPDAAARRTNALEASPSAPAVAQSDQTPTSTNLDLAPSPAASPPVAGAGTPDRYEVPDAAGDATAAEDVATGEISAPAIEPPSTSATENVASTNVVPPSPAAVAPESEATAAIPAAGETPPAAPPTEAGAVVDDTTRIAAATPQRPAAIESGNLPDANGGEDALAGPLVLGTFLDTDKVLLRYDNKTGAWMRVEPRSPVSAGERLLALPEFRPIITLAAGVHLAMSGGTQVAMAAGDAMQADGLPAAGAAVPAVELVYGRIVLFNTSNAENQVRLKLGPNVGDARLAHHATLAIELERQYVPGNDPRQTATPVVARLYVPDGGVEWQDAAAKITIDKGSRWTIINGAATEAVADPSPPEWIDQEPVIHLSEQRYGAPVVESTLVSDRPADIQLLELFKGSARKEVKSLVARSSIHVGLFAPFIDALRDSEQKWPTWRTHIETLRAAMAHSPESAERVWQALVDQRGQRAADDLYKMLCGYSAAEIGTTPEETKSGALARLIDYLESDSLDYRVLAMYDLWEITGKQLMPNPAAKARDRAKNVRIWRSRLELGDLKPVARP